MESPIRISSIIVQDQFNFSDPALSKESSSKVLTSAQQKKKAYRQKQRAIARAAKDEAALHQAACEKSVNDAAEPLSSNFIQFKHFQQHQYDFKEIWNEIAHAPQLFQELQLVVNEKTGYSHDDRGVPVTELQPYVGQIPEGFFSLQESIDPFITAQALGILSSEKNAITSENQNEEKSNATKSISDIEFSTDEESLNSEPFMPEDSVKSQSVSDSVFNSDKEESIHSKSSLICEEELPILTNGVFYFEKIATVQILTRKQQFNAYTQILKRSKTIDDYNNDPLTIERVTLEDLGFDGSYRDQVIIDLLSGDSSPVKHLIQTCFRIETRLNENAYYYINSIAVNFAIDIEQFEMEYIHRSWVRSLKETGYSTKDNKRIGKWCKRLPKVYYTKAESVNAAYDRCKSYFQDMEIMEETKDKSDRLRVKNAQKAKDLHYELLDAVEERKQEYIDLDQRYAYAKITLEDKNVELRAVREEMEALKAEHAKEIKGLNRTAKMQANLLKKSIAKEEEAQKLIDEKDAEISSMQHAKCENEVKVAIAAESGEIFTKRDRFVFINRQRSVSAKIFRAAIDIRILSGEKKMVRSASIRNEGCVNQKLIEKVYRYKIELDALKENTLNTEEAIYEPLEENKLMNDSKDMQVVDEMYDPKRDGVDLLEVQKRAIETCQKLKVGEMKKIGLELKCGSLIVEKCFPFAWKSVEGFNGGVSQRGECTVPGFELGLSEWGDVD